MRVSRADWAALVPWAGVQDKPSFLDGPDGNIQISDVQGLAAALAARALIAQLAKVAFTGNYNDLNNLPVFGSAAFVDISYFLVAWTAKTQQMGQEPLVAGQQSYDIVFTATMDEAPKVYAQVMMTDGTGELFFAVTQRDMITATGLRIWLSGVPSVSAGFIQWKAQVENQPS